MSTATSSFGENSIGKIRSVYCKHFVTYEECTLYPTEYLNVIIGPNGTGKSTLVSAIVLCLGGEPNALYRATDIKDYIKNGKENAKIVVEINSNNHGKTIFFTRTFDTTNKSQYFINIEQVTKKKYLETIKYYKIQVTNLCQFLPQDRVQDFAKMNPQEILASTINSVCSLESIENFKKLKELQHGKLAEEKSLSTDKNKLKESINRVEELKQTFDVFNTRKEFEDKVKVCNAKKMWLEVDEIKKKTKECEIDLKAANERLKTFKMVYEKMINKETVIARINENLTGDLKEREITVKQCAQKIGQNCNQIEELKQFIHSAKSNYEKQKREWMDCQRDLENEKRLLEVVIQDLKNVKTKVDEEQIFEKLQEIENQQLDYRNSIKQVVSKRAEINKKLDEEYHPHIQMLKRRLERLENVEMQKLEILRQKFPDVYSAVMWLRENRETFQGHVYNPMLLELNVRDSNDAKYFENTIQLRDLLAFTCEEKADVSKLVDELCVKKKLAINVGHSPAAERCNYHPNIPIEELHKFGFASYMIDLIEGPASPLNYLCSLYHIHKIPIGDNQVNNYTDAIPTTIRQYFGGDQRFTVSISKYSKEPSVMQLRISGKHLLQSVDSNEVLSLKRELVGVTKKSDALKNERSKLQAKFDDIEFQYNNLKQTKRGLETIKLRFHQLAEDCKRQQQKVKTMHEQSLTLVHIEHNFVNITKQHLNKLLSLQPIKLTALKGYLSAVVERQLSQATIHVFNEENADMVERITEARENMRENREILNNIQKAIETNTRKYNSKMSEALELTNACKPSDRDFPYRKEFAKLPNNVDELKEFVNEYLARLECMGNVNAGIVSEFENKKSEVEMLKQKINDFEDRQQHCLGEINTIYAEWFPEIDKIVDILKRYFGDFMASMNYVGDIALTRNHEHDFESYGIQILVQYRTNEPLQPLDRSRQSGGERAVAIAVYSLSLQHLTHVPFRCVDEINQGMDAKNERKIFEMLVEETTKIGGSQYFFVTPKLLPNLTYNERMSVHIVFNGKTVEKNKAFRWNLDIP